MNVAPLNSHKWPRVRLGDHALKIGSGVTPTGGHASYLESGIALIRSQNVHMNRFVRDGLAFISDEQDAEMAASRVRQGDVLLNITGASIGRVCVVPADVTPANVNQHVTIIRSDGRWVPEFLSYYLSSPSFQKIIFDGQAGATRQALTKSIIEDFMIPLPPQVKQERIAAELTAALAAVDKASRAAQERLAAAEALPASYLREVFEGREAKGWPVAELASACRVITDGTHLPPQFTESGVPFLFVRNIVAGAIDFNVEKYISAETFTELTRRHRAERGDLLFSAVGSFGVAVVVETDHPFAFQRHIAHIKTDSSRLDPYFLAFFLNSPAGRAQSEAVAMGGAQRTVTLKDLRRFRVPLPALTVQQEVAGGLHERLASANELIRKGVHSQNVVMQLPLDLLVLPSFASRAA